MKCSIAPGKILLFGEHFVVKGEPSLGLAVSIYVKSCVSEGKGIIYSNKLGLIDENSSHRLLFTKLIEAIEQHYGYLKPINIYIDSQIPIASGMGSSAAVAVATAHAILRLIQVEFTRDDIWRLAHEAEKAVHYRPSGVDTGLSTYGGLLYYRHGEFKRIDLELPRTVLLLILNTGISRSTGNVVKDVLSRYDRLSEVCEYIYRAGGVIVEKAIEAIKRSDIKLLGELMIINHGLLWAMGASSRECDEAIYEMLNNGVIGGKLSGAGRGGIIIGIVERDRAEIVRSILKEKYEIYTVEPDYQGVREVN
ncbi:MAG: mevalonate kinase [Desulfurococcaceae archaeon]